MRSGTFRSQENDPSSPIFLSISYRYSKVMEAPKTTHVASNLELSTNTQLRSGFLCDLDGFDNTVRVAFPI